MNNNIEDESHFVLKCPLYVNERNSMYHNIIKECKSFGNMSDQNKFVYLMTSENDNVFNAVATFVHNSWKIRANANQPCS